MLKPISQFAILAGFLFIPFFSIAQDNIFAIDGITGRFCQVISTASDNLSCIDENMVFDDTEDFFIRYEEAIKHCIREKKFSKIDGRLSQESPELGSDSEVPFISSFWSAAAICVSQHDEACRCHLSGGQGQRKCSDLLQTDRDCVRQHIETMICSRDLFYRTRAEFCGGS